MSVRAYARACVYVCVCVKYFTSYKFYENNRSWINTKIIPQAYIDCNSAAVVIEEV